MEFRHTNNNGDFAILEQRFIHKMTHESIVHPKEYEYGLRFILFIVVWRLVQYKYVILPV